MNKKRLISVGLATALSLAIAIPAFAQGNENKDFQNIENERDQRKQKSMLEKFIGDYPTSAHRPDYDIQLMTLYFGNQEWQKMMQHADSFALTMGAADAKKKTNLYTLAMEAARQLKNSNKYDEFADKALAADPSNISVLMTMARSLAENPPADAAAKKVSMEKALGYAQRAEKVSKPEKATDAEWLNTQARLHGILGVIYYNQSKWPDAQKELGEYLKTYPSEGIYQYSYGVAVFTQLQQTLASLQQLNSDGKLAQAAGVDVSPYIERMNLRNKEFEIQRDLTIDAMAKAIAIGGAWATPAKAILEPLYKQKNNDSIEGLDPFIASKKAEIAALAPLPAPVVGRGGAPATATGGPAGGARSGGR